MTEGRRTQINYGLTEANEEAERAGYVSKEDSKRRIKILFADHRRKSASHQPDNQ